MFDPFDGRYHIRFSTMTVMSQASPAHSYVQSAFSWVGVERAPFGGNAADTIYGNLVNAGDTTYNFLVNGQILVTPWTTQDIILPTSSLHSWCSAAKLFLTPASFFSRLQRLYLARSLNFAWFQAAARKLVIFLACMWIPPTYQATRCPEFTCSPLRCVLCLRERLGAGELSTFTRTETTEHQPPPT